VAALVLPFAVGCVDDGLVRPNPTEDVPPLSAERRDALLGDGDPHFYFLPPTLPRVPYLGVFEPDALEDMSASVTDPTGGQDPRGGKPDPLPLFVNRSREFYEARWQAPATAKSALVEVALGGRALGSIWLRAAVTVAEERSVRLSGDAPFRPGTLVQIRFRVEVGAGEGDFRDHGTWDGRSEGDSRLFFVPPTSRNRVQVEPFDPDSHEQLAVEISQTTFPNRPALIRRFEASAADPANRLRRNVEKEFYSAAWPTHDVRPWLNYRAKVLLGGQELGGVSVDVVPLDLRGPWWPYEYGYYERARRAGGYAVLAGHVAHIRFRLEKEPNLP